MNKVYQIKINGRYRYFDGECKMFSAKVYKHYPTEDEINDFVKRCSNTPYEDPVSLYDLNINEPYEVKVIELEVID